MKLDYLKIFERAARMVWERRILWLFGVLSLFGSCGSNNISSNYSSGTGSGGGGPSVQQLERIWAEYAAVIIVAALLLILVSIALMIIGYIARGGLIKMVAGFDSGAQPSAGEGFSQGSHYWLKLLGIDLALFMPVVLVISFLVIIGVLVVALTVPGFASIGRGSVGAAAGAGGAVCCAFVVVAVMIIAMIPVIIFLGLMQVLAQRACVLDEDGVFDSIRKAYRLIKTRFGDVALMWLLRLVIGMAIAVVMLLAMLLAIGLPVAAMIFNVWAGIVLLVPGLLVVLLLLGIVEAFTSAAWTIAYRQITSGEPEAPAASTPPAPAPAT